MATNPNDDKTRVRHSAVWKALVIAAALGWGCGCGAGGAASPTDAGDDGAGQVVDDGASNADVVLGAFVVNLVAAGQANGAPVPAQTTILGTIYDGAAPELTEWVLEEEANGCQLLTPKVPFCSPACGSSAGCVAGGTCAPYPGKLDLGLVHVTGLGSSAFDLAPIKSNYQFVGDLPYPPAAEGATVQMIAPGGALGPVALAAKVVAPLIVANDNLHPVAGQPLQLTWTPPGQADLGRILVKVDLSHHGGIKGKILCDVADSGSLQIPAGQITGLLGLGVAGFPSVALTRVATGTAATKLGQVQLQVTSSVERELAVDGVISCTGDENCPTGKTCQADLQCK